jgi:RimJ/RimL family protein N-acetyltransferase
MTVFETERLQVRELQQSDFQALYSMFNDPLVMRYYPSTRDERATQEWLDRMLASYVQSGYALWALDRKADGAFVGQCGLLKQDVDGSQELEIGYLLCSAHWHHGYATEAARACKTYAFENLGRPYVISLVRPVNTPSRAVAERNGMSVWKKTMFRGYETLVYRVDAKSEDTQR